MINLDFLNYLVEYAKTENLTKASKILHVSQSALTRAMQKVEDYVGVPIFDRTKNKLTLNDTGKELVKNAKQVLEAESEMLEKTVGVYNKNTNISIGTVAPGPLIKYENIFYSAFPNKTIVTKTEKPNELVEGLKMGKYDLIFLSKNIKEEGLESKFIFSESLYVTVPKTHFLSQITGGVYFKDIDGQSFLVSNNLGIWDDIVEKHLPKSKFFPQSMENLNELINASTIPNFLTNVSLSIREELGRVSIPILDEDAMVNFYLVYKKSNAKKLKTLFSLIEKN